MSRRGSESGASTPTDREGRAPAAVAVRISGHEYKIRSDGDPEALREIAGYVDRAMQRVRDRTGTVDSLDVAVLTCLNLAREILSLRAARTPEGSTAIEDDKLRGLIERVESALLVTPAGDASDADASETPQAVADASKASDAAASAEGPAGSGTSPGSSAGAAPDSPPETPRKATTLELPSVEALRERDGDPGESGAGRSAGGDLAAPRVAAGGRDRAS